MPALVVLVPGLSTNLTKWNALRERLAQEPSLSGARWLPFEHHKRIYSFGSPERLANELRAQIDQEWAARGPFEEIVLVGHSLGGILVRRAYLLASGADGLYQLCPWIEKVSRIILFAAPNRGLNTSRKRWLSILAHFTRVTFLRHQLWWQIVNGSLFITNMRIQWIRHFARLGPNAPVVVQLLGTRDSLVTRDDSVDIEQFSTAYYIQIPGATHGDLYRLDSIQDPGGRYALLRDAFVHAKPQQAENISISGDEHIVFILHGIRADNKTWVSEAENYIKSNWPKVRPITSSYGYFSALRFAIPWIRRKGLRWFQDEYSQALARNPNARFSFIGHSNGTYLFGESLRQIPGMRFERAVLVGSVLPAEYDWNRCIQREQIQEIRADGSCYDWPVGWLCSMLRGMLMRDVGTGGYDGFQEFAGKKMEVFWYKGGHSAPLASANIRSLADFAIVGRESRPDVIHPRVEWFAFMSRAFGHLGLPIALLLTAGYVALIVTHWQIALIVAAIVVLVVAILDVL